MARNTELTEILESIDPESYLSIQGIDYKRTRGRSGVQLNVRECPVCGNTDFKVFLNAETGAGNCFAGSHPPDEYFNIWSFAKAHLGASNNGQVVQHLKQVAAELGWRPARAAKHVEDPPPDLVLPESIELPQGENNLRYLIDRRISLETTTFFGLRYCEGGWFKYILDGEEKYQNWGGRLIIPVYDLDGTFVTFQGRDVTGQAEKKYLFPPALPSTGRFLLNAHNARGARTIVMGEGAFDVMAIKQALDSDVGTRHAAAVGSFGKHLSIGGSGGDDQLAVLLKMKAEGLREIVLMWDSESRALQDACEAGMALNGYGFTTRLAVLPPGRDPNEVSEQVVRDAFWSAQPINPITTMKVRLNKLTAAA